MEIFNQENEFKEGEKHIAFLLLQKFNSPMRKTRIDTNLENGAFHKGNEVHSMIYRNEENCLQFSLPVWHFFSSTRNISAIADIVDLKSKEGWGRMSWIVFYLAIHTRQLPVSQIKASDCTLYRCK